MNESEIVDLFYKNRLNVTDDVQVPAPEEPRPLHCGEAKA